MKKILFDMTVYQTGTQFHGGGEYSYTILKALMEQKSADTVVDVFIGERGRTDDEVLKRCRDAGMQVLFCRDAGDLTEAVKSGAYDTLYSALPTPKHFKGLKLPADVLMIITLHGLRKLELRESGLYPYFTNLRKCKNDAAELLKKTFRPGKYMEYLRDEYSYLLHITENYIAVTDSWHSFYNTLRYFPQIGKDRMRMYYAPGKIAYKIDDAEYEQEVLKRYGIRSGGFGLILSADRHEKNPVRSLQAWDAAYSDCSALIPGDYKTVVLGAKDSSRFLKFLKNRERFVFRGYVEDRELETLYKHTHLLLFASLNEGFGYPPMEAMKYGTLVAASVNTSIPESCGNAALMFNPLIVSEMTNRILQSFDPQVREEKMHEIPKQYQKIIKHQDEDLNRIVRMILEEKK